jgi:hypothetical protein
LKSTLWEFTIMPSIGPRENAASFPYSLSEIPYPIVFGSDGSLYIGEEARVLRVGVDGRIEVMAGTGQIGSLGDGGPAKQAEITLTALALGPDGTIYIGEDDRIRIVRPDGLIDLLVDDTPNPVLRSRSRRMEKSTTPRATRYSNSIRFSLVSERHRS